MFNEDFSLKIFGVPQFHELVGVARITVLASELAPTVRIDHPAKRHAGTIAARNVPPGREFEILGLALGFERRAFRGEAGDAD